MKNNLFSIFDKYPGLVMGFSQKKDGSMRLPRDFSEDKIITRNRKRFLDKLGIDINSLVSAGLSHGNSVKIAGNDDRGKTIPIVDGLLTNEKDLFLSVTGADCLPIFIYDYKKEIIGLLHAGWRGLVKNIIGSAVSKMANDLGADVFNIIAGVGPGISKCHYETEKESSKFLDDFRLISPKTIIKRNNRIFLDLKKAAEIQLLKLGIKQKNIEVNPECTYCLSDKYFSYCREKPKILKTMMAVMGMIS